MSLDFLRLKGQLVVMIYLTLFAHRAIIELITNEDKRNQMDDYSDEEDDEFVNNI